jgi:hypothetical protein
VNQTAVVRGNCVQVLICAYTVTRWMSNLCSVELYRWLYAQINTCMAVHVLATSHDSLLSREGYFSTVS